MTAEDLDKQLEEYRSGGGGKSANDGGRPGRQRGRGSKRPTVSGEDLDKQLDAYIFNDDGMDIDIDDLISAVV